MHFHCGFPLALCPPSAQKRSRQQRLSQFFFPFSGQISFGVLEGSGNVCETCAKCHGALSKSDCAFSAICYAAKFCGPEVFHVDDISETRQDAQNAQTSEAQ